MRDKITKIPPANCLGKPFHSKHAFFAQWWGQLWEWQEQRPNGSTYRPSSPHWCLGKPMYAVNLECMQSSS
jgi:hypothetical protein